MIITFDGVGHGITDKNFVAKLLGKTSRGGLLFGYARLPGILYIEPALSACMPAFTEEEDGYTIEVEVQNFGQVVSKSTGINVGYVDNNEFVQVTSGVVPKLNPFQKTKVKLNCGNILEPGVAYNLSVSIIQDKRDPATLHGKITIGE